MRCTNLRSLLFLLYVGQYRSFLTTSSLTPLLQLNGKLLPVNEQTTLQQFLCRIVVMKSVCTVYLVLMTC